MAKADGTGATAALKTAAGKKKTLPEMIQDRIGEFKKLLPETMSAERFTAIVVNQLRQNTDLLTCSPVSVFSAVIEAAEQKLEFGAQKHCYLVPFWNKQKNVREAKLILGYQGVLAQLYRSKLYRNIGARAVRENDLFEYAYGSEEHLKHIPMNGGEIIYFYAYARVKDGEYFFEVYPKSEIDRVRDQYADRRGDAPIWKAEYEPMGLKTAIKRFAKMIPSEGEEAVTVARALALDDQEAPVLKAELEKLPELDVPLVEAPPPKKELAKPKAKKKEKAAPPQKETEKTETIQTDEELTRDVEAAEAEDTVTEKLAKNSEEQMQNVEGPTEEYEKCEGCGRLIRWEKTKNGKWTPVNPDGTSHWETCPNAEDFKKGKKRATGQRAKTVDPDTGEVIEEPKGELDIF